MHYFFVLQSMNNRENESFSSCKKFKYSDEKKEVFCTKTENNVLSSTEAENEAGCYLLGPPIKKYISSPITLCLGRKKETHECYLIKTLLLDDSNTSDKRTIFHNEYTFLSLLKYQEGVIQLHDFFKDYVIKDFEGKTQKIKRVSMVLECILPHGYHNNELIPLSQYLKEEKITENEALHILYNLLLIIEKIHKKNIVHREIKLSNIILNRRTLKVKLMDFYYAKLLLSNSESHHNPVMSSSFLKTNDVWAAGIVFYAMLCDNSAPSTSKFWSLLSSVRSPHDLYLKFTENNWNLLNNISITSGAKEILCCILCTLPQYILKASEAVNMVHTLLVIRSASQNSALLGINNSDQIVPECLDFECKKELKSNFLNNLENAYSEIREAKETEQKNEKKLNNKFQKTQNTKKDDEIKVSQFCKPQSKFLKENGLLNRKDVKFAMLRLGATSVNSINALSFNYNKKNSCPS